MQDNFAKIARKPAKDPKQEKLREHKGGWNDVASLLIAKLIAFKRGLNGAGDDRADIPPSKITEPLPQELDIYLDSIIKDYSNLIQGAKFIINEQRDYSREFAGQKAAAEDFNFKVEASSALSRAWARIGLIGDENRKLRINLLNVLSDLIPDLHNMENNLTNRGDKNGHAQAVLDLTTLLLTLKSDIHPFIKLLKGPESDLEPEVESSTQEQKQEIQKQPEDKPGAVVYREKAPEVVNFQEHLLEGLNQLKDNIDEIALRSKIIKKKYPEAPDLAPKAIELSRVEVEIRRLISEDPLGLIANHLEALTYLQEEYNKMVQVIKQYPVNKSEVQDMLSLNDIHAWSQEKQEMEKIAHNAITRWLQRKMISLNPGPGGLTVLRAVQSIKNSIQNIDQIMDLLESRSADLTEVVAKYTELINHLQGLTDDVMTLGKRHRLRKKKLKDKNLLDISKSDLKDLENSMQSIEAL